MKVLDVGCHDGYVGAWLRERYQGDLVLDGLELNKPAAGIARRRGYRHVRHGLAEDAPDLFDAGTYDAVVAYEVIEHVPDMDAFLTALEQMLRPGGLVYLSTPNGTFGTGRNPHHLRVLRAVDLADLARRRGSLVDMEVGVDGITAVSYTPMPRLQEVAIYTGPSWMLWSPMDIATKGLGGSETAVVRLAEQLSEIGWVVTVYGSVHECALRDVVYRDWRAFDPLEPRHAVISSRLPQIFDRPVAAPHRLLWMHDTDCGDQLTQRRADAVDHILTLSRWHTRHVAGLYPFAKRKLTRIRNGINVPYFTAEPAPERRRRVIYTSSPDRGLDVLLELWPQVRDRVPDAELVHAYSPVYWEIARQDPTVAAHAQRIRELGDQPGVTPLESLSQPQVAELMRSAMVWTAPSFCTPAGQPFCETSCIGAMEAQAAGALVVASNWGALTETVKVGRLIDGPALSGRWRRGFVDAIVDGLTNEDTQRWAQAAGPEHAAQLGWREVAVQIAGLIR